MSDSTLGMSGTLTPTKHYGSAVKKTKSRRVRQFGIPGLGRLAFTRDEGDAALFSNHFLDTKLTATLRDPEGSILDEFDLGSGKVTNVGVLALAYDTTLNAKGAEAFNLFAWLKFHAWGTSPTAETEKDIKLNAAAAPNATEANEGTISQTPSGTGAPKFLTTAKIKAESSLEIKEWGLFTQKILSATTGSPLVSVTATSGKATTASFTASGTEVKGERLKIIVPTEATEIWGLITSNTTSVVTIPAWYKQSTGAVQEPVGTSPYTIKPVMWDHKTFTTIGVETGNEIEFKYELEIKSGG